MRLASSSNKIICHDWPSGEILSTYEEQQNPKIINSISWSKVSSWLIFVPDQGTTKIISLQQDAKRLLDITEILNPTCASFQHVSKRNIAIGSSTRLMLYDIKTKKLLKKFKQAPAPFFKVQYLIGDKHLIGGCDNGEIYVYNSVSTNNSCILKVPQSKTLMNFKIHPTKVNQLAGCSEEGFVTTWDINTSKSTMHIKAHNLPVTDIAYCPTKPTVMISIGMDRRICLIDTLINQIVSDVDVGQISTAVDFIPEGTGFVAGFQNGQINAYDMRNLNHATKLIHDHCSKINQILFEPENGCSLETNTIIPEECNFIEETKLLSDHDSIENFICDEVLFNTQIEDGATPKSNTKDSFLEAMGMNSSTDTSTHSNKRKSSVTDIRRYLDFKDNCNTSSPHLEENKSAIRRLELIKSGKLSTPIGNTHHEMDAVFSPIISEIPLKSIAQMVKDAIRDEMKDYKQDLRDLKENVNDLKEELKNLKDDMRHLGTWSHREYLNLQMSIVKTNIKIEDEFNRLRLDLCSPDE